MLQFDNDEFDNDELDVAELIDEIVSYVFHFICFDMNIKQDDENIENTVNADEHLEIDVLDECTQLLTLDDDEVDELDEIDEIIKIIVVIDEIDEFEFLYEILIYDDDEVEVEVVDDEIDVIDDEIDEVLARLLDVTLLHIDDDDDEDIIIGISDEIDINDM